MSGDRPAAVKSKGRRVVPVMAGFGFLCVVLGLSWLGVRHVSAAQQEQEKVPYLYEEYLLRGKAFERMRRDREAFGYFKMAIKAAPTKEMRAKAGMAMSSYLLKRALDKPRPFALMTVQYLDAVLDLTKDPVLRLKAYQEMRDAGLLLDDLEMVARASTHVLELSSVDAVKAQVLLDWMDMCLRKGTLGQMENILLLAEPYEEDPYWKNTFALRRVRTDAQILMRPNWGREFFRSASEPERISLSEGLYNACMASYQKLAEGHNVTLTDECIFRMAELAVYDGNLEKGRELIQDFLLREPDQHIDQALLLMTTIARQEGRTQNADEMITRFLKRYGMQDQVVFELLALLDQMEQEGRIKDALKLSKEYLKYPLEPSLYPDFVARAAHLSAMSGHYLEGEKYMDELLTMDCDQTIVSEALIEQADACMASGAYHLAEQWLLKHLELFANDPLQGECLYKLYDVKRLSGGNITDIMLAGMAAIDENPSDLRAMETLIALAHMLENLGLYNLAQVQYSKVGLLRMTSTGRNRAEADVMGQAVLGSARCLLKMGEIVKADHILREICNNYGPGAVRSEAAYLWAIIARNNGQLREATRRLALAELGQVDPDLQARIMFEKNVIEIASGKGTTQEIMALIERLDHLAAEEDQAFVRKAYIFCFRQLADDEDIEGMQKLLDVAVGQPNVDDLPLRTFCLELASVTLEEKGMDAFARYLERYSSLFENAPEALKTGIEQMINNVDYIGQTNRLVGKLL